MPTVIVRQETDLPAADVFEAACDFSERRAQLWRDVYVQHMIVHELNDASADVTEGNPWPIVGLVWERIHYDWSSENTLEGIVVDSNIFRPGSTWNLRVSPTKKGSVVEIEATRLLRGKGWLLWPFFPTGLAKKDVADYLARFLEQVPQEAR